MTRTSTLPLRLLRVSGFSALAILTTALSGCVSTEQYNAMKLSRDEAVSQLSQSQQQASTATAQYDVLKHQLDAIRNSTDSKEALIANQATTIADLQHQLQDLNAQYQNAISLAGKAGSTPLPPMLTNELTTLAEQNPGLVDFDSARGMIKFKSDVTFPAGSADLTDTVKPVIDKVAQILNGANASQFDLMVVGHTDSQPVSNRVTISRGHLDNWYLSVHRAIGVSKELQIKGVSPARIEVSGYADQRPLVPNDNEADKAKNRRVEVLILPTTTRHAPIAEASPAGVAVTASDRAVGKPAARDANKDAPPAPRVPDSNK
jgi:chemotaxis protein MotB